ncbi:Arylsulfatase [Pontiella desulfatans]|uniref:Arylsulfatase n=1 Tax=Pontiella desulfatans TaxID=2750659 RepID=A0A6C2TXJ9_PONDE|nr:arylsulfatase [Pontiella desulfatans]SPS73659.1 sulfatase S1_20 [Kiritimatiellales bacterium]VGO12355.1 Arylsulfatase [Pontiella desulfatans]
MKNRRNFIVSAAAALAAAPALAGTKGPSLPNIVLVMADDLGWKELGSYGQTKIRTPHLDQMAEEGMRFTQFYTGAPVCGPARCNLMTGKHGGHAYIRNNGEIKEHEYQLNGATIYGGQTPLAAEETTIAEILKARGYKTGCFGKWGLGAAGTTGDPLKKGFDRFYGFNCQRHAHNLYPKYLDNDGKPEFLEGNTRGLTGETYGPQRIADEMLEFVEENHEQPFFVYYPTVLPHLALQAPQADIDAYLGEWEETPYTGKRYLPHPTPRACYAAMISFMDKQVGRLFAQLKELGIDDNTLVIFTSDNGATFLDQVDYEFFDSVGELRGLKGSVYEGGVREPFIARWPGRIPKNAVSDHIGIHYDMLATLAEVAGAEVPENTDGISILPELFGKGGKQKKHDFLLWDFAGYKGQIAVRMGDWKGIRKGVAKNPDAPLELYNLKADLSEAINVAAQHPEIVGKIESIILRERDQPELERFRFGNYRD